MGLQRKLKEYTKDHIMDPADNLLDKIVSLVDLEKNSADEILKQTSSLCRWLMAFLGFVALSAAGLLEGGTTLPSLALGVVGGMIFLYLGGSIIFGSNHVNLGVNKKEKEIYEKIKKLTQEIQTLTESLADEGKKAGVPENTQDQYIRERILRAMSKRHGLILDPKSTVSKELGQTVKVVGSKASLNNEPTNFFLSAKRFFSQGNSEEGTNTQRTFRIMFFGVELIYNWDTDKNKSLRERFKIMRTHAENMKNKLDDIKCMIKKLAGLKNSIETKKRSSTQEKMLIEFAKICCIDAVRTWMETNEKSGSFLKLVDLVKNKIEEERGKTDQEDIDITFLAHGAIKNPLIPASSLLPLSSLQDVVLYSPWNCYLCTDAAYGIATGRLEPKHRVFICGDEVNCKIKQEGHQPTKLPEDWNSMKDAAKRQKKIPTVLVYPLSEDDPAWKHVQLLQGKHGQPGKNRILIPFLLPGVSDDFNVPFFVVTLALSLVLYFLPYKATVHLTTCLGRSGALSEQSKSELKQQYSYTTDETAMKASDEMLDGFLTRFIKNLFGLY